MKVAINNKTRTKIDEGEIQDLVTFYAKLYKLQFTDLSIGIVGDQTMRRLNKKYRGLDAPTDILSFEGEDEYLGELIIDFAQIKRQKAYFSSNSQEELLFIIVHGLLHLIGFEDDEEQDRLAMVNRGEKILRAFYKTKLKN